MSSRQNDRRCANTLRYINGLSESYDTEAWKYYMIKFKINQASRRRGRCCTITLLHMNRFHKPESAIFVSLMSSRGSSFRTYFIYLHCSWCCAVRRPLSVSPYIVIVQIIYFLVLWDYWAHSESVENRVPLFNRQIRK